MTVAKPGHSIYIAPMNFDANIVTETGESLARVSVRIDRDGSAGDFRLPPSADVGRILKEASALKMNDGSKLRVTRICQCTGVHQTNPHMPHIEVEFETQPADMVMG